MKFSHVLNTSGTGLWSNQKRAVKVHAIDIDDYGELRVYFTRKTWDVEKHGLIYTDPKFLTELRRALRAAGFVGAVDYSEQGMQGDDYVSLDTGKNFRNSFERLSK